MYNDYFGFATAPFSIAPNPHFLYMSERHREALAHLLYGIRSDGGFILLTGEVGTGKTTTCRCLLEQIPEDVDTAFILNPKLTATELLATACDDLGVSYPENASIKQLTDVLNDYLLKSLAEGRRTVLIIDEAQNLSTDVLEQLRLLTNLETNQRKLLQIILLGQPELLEMLDRNELRQLSQRITARFHLDALGKGDVDHYIAHRIELAGGNPALFSKGAIKRVYQLSGGVPRLINLICDRALLGTYASNGLQVQARIVDQAATEILGKKAPAARPKWQYAAVAVLLLALIPTLSPFVTPTLVTQEVATEESVVEPPPVPQPEPATTIEEPIEPEPAVTATINPVDPTPAMQTDPLNSVKGDPNTASAMARLLGTWNVPVTSIDPEPCDTAERFDLSCLSMIGSLRDLEALNRPAIVKLSVEAEDHYLTVTRIENDVITVINGSNRYRLQRADILRSWDGSFTLLWRPPEAFRMTSLGDSGPIVTQLSRQLALVSEGPVQEDFDEALEDRLKRFQLSVSLPPDGIAGELTWIHLNQATDPSAPTLGEQG